VITHYYNEKMVSSYILVLQKKFSK